MRIKLMAFTTKGLQLGEQLAAMLLAHGHLAELKSGKNQATPLDEWVREGFASQTPLIFIGATGIAVRCIAPHIRHKTTDPAVVVIDTLGRYVIPLLSGHLGGANAFAQECASLLDATAVLTTATDTEQVFAVDSWAKLHHMAIINPERIKHVSSALLDGRTVRFSSHYPWLGTLPQGLAEDDTSATVAICVGYHKKEASLALQLVPASLTLGIGCRKDTSALRIETAVSAFLEQHEIYPEALGQVCSIDLKQNEPGLLQFCHSHGLPFRTFSAEELRMAPGQFSSSAFVHSVTGADNVCERSAVLGSNGKLIVAKTIINSITLALAETPIVLTFPTKEVHHD